jgi:hypothetical protein
VRIVVREQPFFCQSRSAQDVKTIWDWVDDIADQANSDEQYPIGK